MFAADLDHIVLLLFVRGFFSVLEPSVPDLVDGLNLLFAELHPLEELGPASLLLHGHSVGTLSGLLLIFVIRSTFGGLVVNFLLSDVADALGNLDDLTHVHA